MTVMHRSKPRTATPTDWVVEDIAAGTFRVHRAALVEEAVFRDEQRAVFERCWLYVGHASEIPTPGDFRARDVGTRPLVFWHGHDGVRRVFYNSCRHRGALVCRVPEGHAKTMNGFSHAWTYGSTGALTGLPDEEGYGPTFNRACMGLRSPAQVDSDRGFVFACFDPGAVDLRTYLAGAADYLDSRSTTPSATSWAGSRGRRPSAMGWSQARRWARSRTGIAAWLRQTIQHRRAVLTHRLCGTHPDGRPLSDVPASHGARDPVEHMGAR